MSRPHPALRRLAALAAAPAATLADLEREDGRLAPLLSGCDDLELVAGALFAPLVGATDGAAALAARLDRLHARPASPPPRRSPREAPAVPWRAAPPPGDERFRDDLPGATPLGGAASDVAHALPVERERVAALLRRHGGEGASEAGGREGGKAQAPSPPWPPSPASPTGRGGGRGDGGEGQEASREFAHHEAPDASPALNPPAPFSQPHTPAAGRRGRQEAPSWGGTRPGRAVAPLSRGGGRGGGRGDGGEGRDGEPHADLPSFQPPAAEAFREFARLEAPDPSPALNPPAPFSRPHTPATGRRGGQEAPSWGSGAPRPPASRWLEERAARAGAGAALPVTVAAPRAEVVDLLAQLATATAAVVAPAAAASLASPPLPPPGGNPVAGAGPA
jgi:hypothetical protein